MGSRNGVFADTKDGYEMIKVGAPLRTAKRPGADGLCLQVSRDEIQKDSPHVPSVIKNSGDLGILEDSIASCNIITKVLLSALSTGMGLTGAARFENAHRNDRPSTTTLAMMHYVPTEPDDRKIGHQKHTDISSLTLLFAEQWGLQIRPPGAREFGFVKPKDGCAVINVGDSLRFASGHRMQSCIHRVVPFKADEHRYSIAYFLRAEDDTPFTDSEGRQTTAGQWHDEKFFAFTADPEFQAAAPSSLLLGGMKEHDDDVYGAPQPEIEAPPAPKEIAVQT